MAKKSEILKCKSKRIISIGEESTASEIFMSIKFCLLDTITNLNNINYSPAFLQEIADNPQKYLSLPLMAEFNKLSQGKTDNLTHAYNQNTGEFSSQMIGSFINFTVQQNADDNTILELVGEARIPKRFTDVIEILQELFDAGNLTLSYEMAIGEYKQVGKVKYVDVSEFNYLFGMAIVTNPAVLSAHSLTLVANIIEGGENQNLQRNKETFTAEDMFKNSKINLAELDICQVKTKLFNQLRENMQDNFWMYDSQDIGVDYVILKNYDTADLIKVEFNVSNNNVNITDTYDVDRTYTKKLITNIKEEGYMKTVAELEIEVAAKDAVIKEKDAKIKEKDTEIDTTKKDAKAKDAKKDEEIDKKDKEVKAKTAEIAEMNAKLTTLSASVISKDTEIASLLPMKEAFELAEKTKSETELSEKKVALKAKYSNLLDEKVMAEVEIAEALDKLDEAKLNSRIVEIAMASTVKVPGKVALASRITDNVRLAGASEPGSLQEKYSI
ncbi:hypothetical protein [Clostridium estertheticum]|uniref:hypothetical protein n=1 Tax=Clostridium estertheticum TaxID=238834 RepID=UPI001C0D81A7|nr:hypothetical protein [Clostridium estertheticum]MBU3186646.1 hypothetical protein [Clostridium estertheticum]